MRFTHLVGVRNNIPVNPCKVLFRDIKVNGSFIMGIVEFFYPAYNIADTVDTGVQISFDLFIVPVVALSNLWWNITFTDSVNMIRHHI
ncbi:MAG: hypothetical protein BWY65_02142 [Firmicutes bacterium ADurb.Bin373]|nr:MAG: hypothetical protein BWY65_02142 [Firmicutes bacterium ADurb.Bin373]